ncbi:MAG: TPM domain-containing protein [Acidobacteriota bacterium]
MRARTPFAALLLLAATVSAKEVPFLSGRVNDLAGLLDANQRERVEARLAALEQATGAQVAVLTVDSLEGEVLEDYTMRVVETWKLGRQGHDDGVLFLVAVSDRKMRLEVGYGLEGTLTDALTRRILDNVVRPRFKAGDFGGGIEAGVESIAGTLQGQDVVPAEAPAGAPAAPPPLAARIVGMVIFTLVVSAFSVIAVISSGCQSWFLYFFLMPFYLAFPSALLTPYVGLPIFAAWLIGFPILKFWLGRTPAGKAFVKAHPSLATFVASAARSSSGRGWSSGGGWSSGSSSSGSSFSGGGGSFGGGGSSSSW